MTQTKVCSKCGVEKEVGEFRPLKNAKDGFRWSSFENFYKDMGPRPARRMSIERIENAGHYCTSNCKWATPIEQANNRSSTRLVTYKGSTQSLSAWCRELNINLSTVTGRLDVHGWSVEDAFGTPTRKGFVERNKTKNAVAPVDEGIL